MFIIELFSSTNQKKEIKGTVDLEDYASGSGKLRVLLDVGGLCTHPLVKTNILG